MGAPLAVTVPYAGSVGTGGDPSYYELIAIGGTNGIFLTLLTANVDPAVFTDLNFTTVEPAWTCTTQTGTLDDNCQGTGLTGGAPVYVKVINLTGGAGATFTLNLTD